MRQAMQYARGYDDPGDVPRALAREAPSAARQADLRLRWQVAALIFEAKLALLREEIALKYSPSQPRVPAGGPRGGQWTRGGGGGGVSMGTGDGTGVDTGGDLAGSFAGFGENVGQGLGSASEAPVLVAGDVPPLRILHSDETYKIDQEARRSREYWTRQSTQAIIESYSDPKAGPLTVKPDGTVMNGNTRLKILAERGYDINSLPRTPHVTTPIPDPPVRGGGGSTGGRGGGFGGGPVGRGGGLPAGRFNIYQLMPWL